MDPKQAAVDVPDLPGECQCGDTARAFCGRCESPLCSRRNSVPGKLQPRTGLILDIPQPEELTRQYGEFALPWIGPLARMAETPQKETA
ncbi:hypothetical protein BA950_10230 [Erythrobacter sp. SAORIC-644]|nr:hypothetical protein BA950_10230 [Erythrobacter sp. SAORIC-644]